MGYTTEQYSSKEIIVIYRKYISTYRNIIDEVREFSKSSFVKEKNIGFFLNEHIVFCEESIDVLENAIKQIQSDTVDKNMCMRLEKLFASCAKEHKKLEDTYSRVPFEETVEFYAYQDIHIKLRDICDEMEYGDETVKFVKNLVNISTNTNINIFYGDARDIQIQQGTDESTQMKCGNREEVKEQAFYLSIKKEQVSVKHVLNEKGIDLVIGGVLIIVALLLKKCVELKNTDMFHVTMDMWCLAAYFVCIIVSIAFIVSFLVDVICFLKLCKKGGFVEFLPKTYLISLMLNSLKEEKKVNVRRVGKCFTKDNDNIYQIKNMICPFCKSQPIGEMYLVKNIEENKYYWRCSQYSSHQVEFDYKQKF